jgi:hypothetical protein
VILICAKWVLQRGFSSENLKRRAAFKSTEKREDNTGRDLCEIVREYVAAFCFVMDKFQWWVSAFIKLPKKVVVRVYIFCRRVDGTRKILN